MFHQLVLSGIAVGSMYGIIALGFQLTYAVSKTMNFSQGASVMLGAVLCYTFTITWKLPVLVAVFGTLVFCALYGLVVERIAVRPFAQNGSNSWLLTTIAIGIVAENIALHTFGKEVRGFPSPLATTPTQIFGLGLYPMELLIPAIGLAIALVLRLVFNRTLVGRSLQAVSENPVTARMMGINVERSIALIYAISTGLAGLAGMLIAPIANVSAEMGTLLGLKAFAVAIIGGLDKAWGVMGAGIIYGTIESIAAGYLGGSFREIVGFSVAIALLTAKPNGIFSRIRPEKV
jgi:branched-chain amino acid transport system permease protein